MLEELDLFVLCGLKMLRDLVSTDETRKKEFQWSSSAENMNMESITQ